jgi:hypothetical protein
MWFIQKVPVQPGNWGLIRPRDRRMPLRGGLVLTMGCLTFSRHHQETLAFESTYCQKLS